METKEYYNNTTITVICRLCGDESREIPPALQFPEDSLIAGIYSPECPRCGDDDEPRFSYGLIHQ
jgi:hypothetical protein